MDTKKVTNLDGVDNDGAITKRQMEVGLSTKPNKNNVYSNKRNLDLQDKFNVVKSKQQSFTHLKTNYDNLISVNDVNNIFLSRQESFPMKANLDMGNFNIHNVKNDDNKDGFVNKGDIDKADNNHVPILIILNTEKFSNPTPVNLNMSNNNIINLKEPRNNSDASNKSYVDNSITNFNTKISNLVLDSIETEKRIKNMLMNHTLLVVQILKTNSGI